MQTFVINLYDAKQRRASITKQLKFLHIQYEIFNGVYAKNLSPEEIAQSYNRKKSLRIQGRDLTASEIGCALSHIGVYKRILEKKLPIAFILEDDSIISKDVVDILPLLFKILASARPKVILLSSVFKTKGRGHFLSAKYKLAPFYCGYFANAYVINEAAARALNQFLYPVGDVADCWHRLRRYGIVDIYAVVPPLVAQDQETFGSSTTQDIQKNILPRRGLKKYIYKGQRAFWLCMDLFYAKIYKLKKSLKKFFI